MRISKSFHSFLSVRHPMRDDILMLRECEWIMDKNEEDLIVGGYRFATVADAETARLEKKKIENLEQHLDFRNTQNVLMVYNKAIDNRVFLTPLGMAYLQRMQGQLLKCGVPEEKIRPVPLYGTYSNKTENSSSIRKSLETRGVKPEYRGRFVTSFCINILLVVAIGMLILLSLRSDLPTIVNYRTAIVNEYSEWEQELTERERAVREAEGALEK